MKKIFALVALLSLPFLTGAGTVVKTLNPGGQLGPAVVDLPKITAPYTTVVNRAKVTDFANDLMPKFGIDRIMTQQIMAVPGETGPNGEPVWKFVNDIHDQVRFVGGWDIGETSPDADGVYVYCTASCGYAEFTFYGTGLNLLITRDGGRLATVAVDGGSAGSNILTGTSAILSNRNYTQNIVYSAASGLSAGMHTVRINVGGANLEVVGFEILNVSPTPTPLLTLSPGSSYVNGQKLTKSSSSTTAYNSGFESGTLSTNGGHVIVYQKSDGSVAKAVTATGTPAYLTNANHTNEEIVRTHHWREFGAGRTDDFSLLGSISNRAFTLDDGTTTLVGSNVFKSNSGEVVEPNALNAYLTLTFVGTGLDLVVQDVGTAMDTGTIYVDGTSVGNLAGWTSAGSVRTQKIASGLPYGTHTVKLLRATYVNGFQAVSQFIIYAPKTPTLPAGAVALADYFVMADYNYATATGTTAADIIQVPAGVLAKHPAREFVYVGANWVIGAADPSTPGGFNTTTLTTNSQPGSLTFFGNGVVVYLGGSAAGTYDVTINIDGVANSTGVARTNASNLGGGSYRATSATTYVPVRIEFTGLSLGTHTVSIQRSAGAGNFSLYGAHIITPIHAPKLNGPFVVQNTLSIGSQSIRDLRQFSVAQGGQQKMVAQAIGVSSTPTTTSTTAVPRPDMSVSVKTFGNPVEISYSASDTISAGYFFRYQVYVDGVAVGTIRYGGGATSTDWTSSDSIVVPVSAGFHKIDLYGWVNSGSSTLTGEGTSRGLKVREL